MIDYDRGSEPVTREQQARQFIAAYGANRMEIQEALDAQFRTLQNRAQVLLAITGVLVTASVMLMAGKLIGRPQLPHVYVSSRLMVGAGVTDIMAAAIAVGAVLRIEWATPPDGELEAWVMARLAYRDRKTRALHTSIGLLLVSMILYQLAATVVLLQL